MTVSKRPTKLLGSLLAIGILFAATSSVIFRERLCSARTIEQAGSSDGRYQAGVDDFRCPPGAAGSPEVRGWLSETATPNRQSLIARLPLTYSGASVTWVDARKLLVTVPGTVPAVDALSSYPDVEVSVQSKDAPPPEWDDDIPGDTSASLDPPAAQEVFKRWLTAQKIPFRLKSSHGREYVIWDAKDSQRVLKWDHLAEVHTRLHEYVKSKLAEPPREEH